MLSGNSIYGFYTIFKRDLVNIVLNPVLLISNTLFPVVLVILLSYLTSGSYGSGGVTAYDYYAVTILIYAILNAAMTASNSFMEKSLKTSNLRIMYAPIKLSYIYMAKIVATFIFTSVCFLGYIAFFRLVFGVNFGGENLLYVILIVLFLNLLSSVTGIFFCCVFKSEELTNKIISVVINIFAILGGLFFRLDGLGPAAERISFLSPAKWASEAMFRIIYDSDFSVFVPGILILFTVSVALLIGCKITFKVEDYV